jgi:sulfite reductase (ferredoxin)
MYIIMTAPASLATADATPTKETKAQKTERLKLTKNPWEAFDEIRQFARDGRDSVPDEWALYFRWWGVYSQGDGLGLAGGKGGEGKATEFFMMRIAIPNGLLTSHQLRIIAGLTQKYARNLADITTRQNIQLHWLTIADLVDVADALTQIGLSPKGACGDVVRNVTGCPLAGINHDELVDASPLAIRVAKELSSNTAFYNLPRKFKISVTGCPLWCNYPEVNDVALTALKRVVDGNEEVGFTLRVGGGLSTEPFLATRIPAFVRQDQAFDVVKASAEIFRDTDILRENRLRARSKYLFLRFGWTPESYLETLEAKLGYKLIPSPTEDESIPADIYRDHIGINPQRQSGLSSVGVSVLRGRVTGDQLFQLADLAEKYGDGKLRTTIMQNIILVNIPHRNTAALVVELNTIGFKVDVSVFWRGAIACTGTEFCKLAITETKGFSKWLVSEMEDRLPGFEQQIKLHITGCTNSCGQHWLADIGLEGKRIKKDGKLVDAFHFCVGGAVGKYARTSRPLGYRAVAEDVPDAIERLLSSYIAGREPNEDLRSYFARTDDETLRAQLHGAIIDPVGRDAPPARSSHLAPSE